MNIDEAIQSAVMHLQGGDLQQAKLICRKILGTHPNNAGALHSLGVVYCQFGDYDSATELIKKSLLIDPANDGAHYDLGNILRERGQLEDAVGFYRKAVQLNPAHAGAHYCMGVTFQEKKYLNDAIASYRKVLQINPNHADSYNNIGSILQEKGEPGTAITFFRQALLLNPRLFVAYNNLGNALVEMGQFDEAIVNYQEAIALEPGSAGTYCNLGVALQNKGQIDEAIASYRKAVTLDPDYIDAHWNLSLVLLLSGRFRQGWREYEWRLKKKEHVYYGRKLSQSLWYGSDLRGLNVLLHAEQGLGDTIQFIRYAPLVAQKGARVVVECQKELKTLLRNVEGVQEVVAYGEQLPAFDLHCPLLSLPLIFDTTLENIPAGQHYIKVDPLLLEKWRAKVRNENSALKIGLVWSGSATNIKGRYRSCSLEMFSPLAKLGNVAFYSLQKGESSQQAKTPPKGMGLFDYTEEINDFSDTAAFIHNLDLVISVDTSVAHLAGALGKSVWILLPFAPDWRWMLNREDSPWYDTMKLFRQPSPGDWESVMDRVVTEFCKTMTRS